MDTQGPPYSPINCPGPGVPMFRQNNFSFCFHAIKGLLAPIWQNDELVGHRGSTMQATPVDIQCVLKKHAAAAFD